MEPLPDHIQCAKCAKIKPRKYFKRRLTPKEMRRYGKSGESGLLMTVLSKYCSQCRPRKKRIESLGLAALQRIKKEGAEFHRTTEYKLEKLLEIAQTKDVASNQARSLKLRQQHAREFYASTIKSVDSAIIKLRPRASATNQSEEKRAYFRLALDYAIRTREFIKADTRAGIYPKGESRFMHIEELLKPHELKELSHAYEQIPEHERKRMRRTAFS